jgi:hypothetical protein
VCYGNGGAVIRKRGPSSAPIRRKWENREIRRAPVGPLGEDAGTRPRSHPGDGSCPGQKTHFSRSENRGSGKIGKFDAPPPAHWERTSERVRESSPAKGPRARPKTHFSRSENREWEKWETRLLHPQSLRGDSGTGNHFTRGDRHSRWRDPRRPKNPLFPTPKTESGKIGKLDAPPSAFARGTGDRQPLHSGR